jgi:TctA family transporter
LIEPIADALVYLVEPAYWGAVFAAVGLAAMASIVPGVNSFLVMALAIPIIFFKIDDPAIGLILLATITGVDNTLDSIPAVLLGQPSAATQVTFLEGHQLARQGKAAHTLGAIYAVSALGGLVGAAALTLAIPVIRPFVLEFGFSEIAAMALVGLGMVAVLSRGAVMKGLIASMIGLLFGLIGRDPAGSTSRLTVGPIFGLELVPVALGLFALPEMIDLTLSRQAVAAHGATISNREVFRGARDGLRHWRMVIRQSLFGVFLGAIPGVGSAVIDWLSYAFGILFAKDKSQFGKGSLEGVIFAEASQNAKEGGQAIPTLAMGVPGGPTWVLVLAGMIAFGISPGPEMLGSNAHVTILLVITLAIGNLLITMLGLLVTGQLAKLTTVPFPVIGAIIIPITLLSSFVETTSWRGIQMVFAMGVIGLAMKHYGWPRPPLLLAFILAPIIERNFFNGLAIHGTLGVFTDILTMTIVGVAIATTFLFVRGMSRLDGETKKAERYMMKEGLISSVSDSTERVPVRWTAWRWDYAVHIALVTIATIWLIDASGYRGGAWKFPVALTIGVLTLTFADVLMTARNGGKRSSIMDLGMTSIGMEGVGRATMRLAMLFGLFLLVGTTLHLAYAAILLGTLIPIAMLRGLRRYPVGFLAGGFVSLFTVVVLDNLLFVIWPTPFLTGWDLPWGYVLPFVII